MPPLVLLNTPAPRIASALPKPSPVPAYITLELVGSTISELTARLAIQSSIGVQVVLAEQQLVVFQMPPETPPINTVLALSGRIARMRPPTLPGPACVQLVLLMPAAELIGPFTLACRAMSLR